MWCFFPRCNVFIEYGSPVRSIKPTRDDSTVEQAWEPNKKSRCITCRAIVSYPDIIWTPAKPVRCIVTCCLWHIFITDVFTHAVVPIGRLDRPGPTVFQTTRFCQYGARHLLMMSWFEMRFYSFWFPNISENKLSRRDKRLQASSDGELFFLLLLRDVFPPLPLRHPYWHGTTSIVVV